MSVAIATFSKPREYTSFSKEHKNSAGESSQMRLSIWSVRSIQFAVTISFSHASKSELGAKKSLRIVFILYLLPGFPKDLINYVAGISNLRLSAFLISATAVDRKSVV